LSPPPLFAAIVGAIVTIPYVKARTKPDVAWRSPERRHTLREWLNVFAEQAVVIIDIMAAVLIVIGTVEAFITAFTTWAKPNHEKREVWLRYARWLIAGMSFQLASDIIETSVRMTWTALGQLAVVAVIRTFLNYFLERDVTEMRDRQRHPATARPALDGEE